jgi:hypothetical protein
VRTRYPITTQKFTGARFEDHGLDLEVLQELIAYKALPIETAKSLWRAKNPSRQRRDNLVLLRWQARIHRLIRERNRQQL